MSLSDLKKGSGTAVSGRVVSVEEFRPRAFGCGLNSAAEGLRKRMRGGIGCLTLPQLLLQVHEDAESDPCAQRGQKGYGEPHESEQCVFHRSFLSPKPSETISRLNMMATIVKAITITPENTSPLSQCSSPIGARAGGSGQGRITLGAIPRQLLGIFVVQVYAMDLRVVAGYLLHREGELGGVNDRHFSLPL